MKQSAGLTDVGPAAITRYTMPRINTATPAISETLIASNIERWYNAVMFTGNEILRNANALFGLPTHEDNSLEKREIISQHKFMFNYFFLLSLNKLIDWASESENETMVSFLDSFKREFPSYKDLRNMKEHEIDYIKGAGNAQSRYSHERNDLTPYISGTAKVSASSTLIVPGKHLLGGRLDVIGVLGHLEKRIGPYIEGKKSASNRGAERKDT